MRKSNHSISSGVDQQSQNSSAHAGCQVDNHKAELACKGGLRLQGVVSRRSKRTLKDDLELVTYCVSSERGSDSVEDFSAPGGPYLSLGQAVDLEVIVRAF